jgi:hypothetical protein
MATPGDPDGAERGAGDHRMALLDSLVDDAGLFPPTALAMEAAVERHRHDLMVGERMLTHRFLCPASRIEELREHLHHDDGVRVGLIADRGQDGLDEVVETMHQDPRLSLALVEVPLGAFDADPATAVSDALSAFGATPADVPAFLEPAAVDQVAEVVAALPGSERTLGAKLRCGGVRAEFFPSAEQVAHFIATCVTRRVPFKATAGLHRAVRHRSEETGFTHHGYLNLLLATAVASSGAMESAVRYALEIDDPDSVRTGIDSLDRTTVARARAALVSYGSCSTSTPVEQAREVLTPQGKDARR